MFGTISFDFLASASIPWCLLGWELIMFDGGVCLSNDIANLSSRSESYDSHFA